MAKKKTKKQKLSNIHVPPLLGLVILLCAASIATVSIVTASTLVKGHQKDKYDQDNNGYPDAGQQVNGHYTSIYAYDANSDWYWDLGDGRLQGSVASLADLDQSTLTRCDYVVNYRGSFENNPFLNNGWIQNHINCSGHDDNNQYNYLIVHESDPRYRGIPENEIWGTWEYHVNTQSGLGNLARPSRHTGS